MSFEEHIIIVISAHYIIAPHLYHMAISAMSLESHHLGSYIIKDQMSKA
jgi:hypothetical protein